MDQEGFDTFLTGLHSDPSYCYMHPCAVSSLTSANAANPTCGDYDILNFQLYEEWPGCSCGDTGEKSRHFAVYKSAYLPSFDSQIYYNVVSESTGANAESTLVRLTPTWRSSGQKCYYFIQVSPRKFVGGHVLCFWNPPM